jgi:hypothetical protein
MPVGEEELTINNDEIFTAFWNLWCTDLLTSSSRRPWIISVKEMSAHFLNKSKSSMITV